MTAINVNGTDYYTGRTVRGCTEVTTVDCTVIGHIERVESVGPRGGSVVEWVAYSAYVPDRYPTRREAVEAVVAGYVPQSVESAPVESCPTNTVPSSDACTVCVSVDGDCLCSPVEDAPDVQPCPCGDSYVDGVCSSCDSCAGCAECAPKHSYAGSVSHEVLSVDVQRHAAYLDAPASVVARVRVRYSFPDAPDRVHGFLFSFNEGEPWSVRMTSTVPSGTGLVTVYNPARFGSFSVDPVSWVHSFYA